MNNRTKGISLAIITAVMWGIMGMFVRGLTGYAFTTFEISFFRCALAGGAYFLFLLFTKPSALKINLKGLVICLLYGAVAYSISFVSYSVAVSRIPVGVATVLMFMSPIWVAILGRFMFGEKLPKSKMVTILICLIGAVFVANLIGGGDIKLMAACGLFLGWKITLVSAALAILFGGIYGCYLLAAKKADRKAHFAFGPFLCIGMAIGLLYGGQLIDWYLSLMVY